MAACPGAVSDVIQCHRPLHRPRPCGHLKDDLPGKVGPGGAAAWGGATCTPYGTLHPTQHPAPRVTPCTPYATLHPHSTMHPTRHPAPHTAPCTPYSTLHPLCYPAPHTAPCISGAPPHLEGAGALHRNRTALPALAPVPCCTPQRALPRRALQHHPQVPAGCSEGNRGPSINPQPPRATGLPALWHPPLGWQHPVGMGIPTARPELNQSAHGHQIIEWFGLKGA